MSAVNSQPSLLRVCIDMHLGEAFKRQASVRQDATSGSSQPPKNPCLVVLSMSLKYFDVGAMLVWARMLFRLCLSKGSFQSSRLWSFLYWRGFGTPTAVEVSPT
jgi:hypothetical protein